MGEPVLCITSNLVGTDDIGGVSYYGQSRVIARPGRVFADTADAEGIAFAEIDLDEGTLDARTGPFFGYNLRDRRPDVYSNLDLAHPFEPRA